MNLLINKKIYLPITINLTKQNYKKKITKTILKNITDKKYARTNIIWNYFNIKNLGEYYNLYLIINIYIFINRYF